MTEDVQLFELAGVEVALYRGVQGNVIVEITDVTDEEVYVYANSHCLTINNDCGNDFPWPTER